MAPAPARTLIMIVETELQVRAELMNAVQKSGFLAVEADDAEAALEIMCQRAIGALITDVSISNDTDGLVLASSARQLYPQLPVVFASARVDCPKILNEILRNLDPPLATVVKPYPPSAIPNILKRLLANQTAWIRYSDFPTLARHANVREMGGTRLTRRAFSVAQPQL